MNKNKTVKDKDVSEFERHINKAKSQDIKLIIRLMKRIQKFKIILLGLKIVTLIVVVMFFIKFPIFSSDENLINIIIKLANNIIEVNYQRKENTNNYEFDETRNKSYKSFEDLQMEKPDLKILTPAYIPENFILDSINLEYSTQLHIISKYINTVTDKAFIYSIDITIDTNTNAKLIEEKTDATITKYQSNNGEYYILKNTKWKIGFLYKSNQIYGVYGLESNEEIKKFIENLN